MVAAGNGPSIEGEKRLQDIREPCTWFNNCTGDVISTNYKKPPQYGLNPIYSCLDLVIKMSCRCQPSISPAKHAAIWKSPCKHINCSVTPLKPESIYCPWNNSSSGSLSNLFPLLRISKWIWTSMKELTMFAENYCSLSCPQTMIMILGNKCPT